MSQATSWEEKRQRGFVRYLIYDGILRMGAPFALVMQVLGAFLFREEGHSVGDYFTQSRTWTTFFLHATLFGGVMGVITWMRNEKAFLKK